VEEVRSNTKDIKAMQKQMDELTESIEIMGRQYIEVKREIKWYDDHQKEIKGEIANLTQQLENKGLKQSKLPLYKYRSDAAFEPQRITIVVGEGSSSREWTFVVDLNVEKSLVPRSLLSDVKEISPYRVEVPWRNVTAWVVRAEGHFRFYIEDYQFTVKQVGVIYSEDGVTILGRDFKDAILDYRKNTEGCLLRLRSDDGYRVTTQGNTHTGAVRRRQQMQSPQN